MRYAQFWHKGTDGRARPACGDRSVVIIDSRLSTANMHAIARETCEKRGYLAYDIREGETFTRSRTLQSLPAIPSGGVIDTCDIHPDFIGRMGRINNN